MILRGRPMSNKDLQRVTESLSYIGHASEPRRSLSIRRNHITQKVRISVQRTLSLTVHDDEHPVEIFLRLKEADRSSDLIGLSDAIARPEVRRCA